MKTMRIVAVLFAVVCVMFCGTKVESVPMSTVFSYQGRLIDANEAADGLYDLQFKLFNAVTSGDQVGGDVNVPDVDVIDGYFTVLLDFGSDVFDGNGVWLDVGIRAGEQEDPNAYTTLSPRQEVTPVPYALQTRGLFVDQAGKVGIGTTSPKQMLTINDNITGISPGVPGLMIGNNGNSAVWLGKDSNNYGEFAWINPYLRIKSKGEIRFQTGGWIIDKIVFDEDGNVGLDESNPSERLDVTGNIHLTGDIKKDVSGGTMARATPIAYGFIDSSGTVDSGSPNVSCTWTGTHYEITIAGESYYYNDYVTTVTPSGSTFAVATTNSASGKLIVYIRNISGATISSYFQFVTYKP